MPRITRMASRGVSGSRFPVPGVRASRAPIPYSLLRLVVSVLLCLAKVLLDLALERLALRFQVLAVVAGDVGGGVADLAFRLLRRAGDLVLYALRAEIVRHAASSVPREFITCESLRYCPRSRR